MTRIVAITIAALFALSAPAEAKERRQPVIKILGAKAKRTRAAVEKLVEASDAPIARVEGRVLRRKRRLMVRLTFRNSDGKVMGRARYRGRNDKQLARAVARGLDDKLASLPKPRKGKPAGDETASKRDDAEPASEVDRDDDREVAEVSGSSDVEVGAKASLGDASGPATWSVAAGPELLARGYSYRDNLFGELREYDLPGALAFGLRADWYPLLGRKLGVAGRVSLAPSFSSGDPSGESFTSSASSFAGGLRYRHALGGIDVTGEVDYGAQSFSIEAAEEGGPDSGIPDVSYRYLRAGVGAAMPLTGRFALAGHLGYRHVLSTGEISSDAYFPRLSARGMDVGLALIVGLTDRFDLRAGAELERYGYDLAPEPGDMRVAGGAVDQYPHFFLRVGYAP